MRDTARQKHGNRRAGLRDDPWDDNYSQIAGWYLIKCVGMINMSGVACSAQIQPILLRYILTCDWLSHDSSRCKYALLRYMQDSLITA